MASSAVSRISHLYGHLHPVPNSKIKGLVKVSPDVAEALSRGKAVVALETTIISHGMTYPQNLETAKELQTIVAEHGAIPATIAIIDGVLCIGLSMDELERFAALGPRSQKTARRDIAHVIANKGSRATTVSSTMFFASLGFQSLSPEELEGFTEMVRIHWMCSQISPSWAGPRWRLSLLE